MSASVLFRPGVVHGRYPQKKEPSLTALQQILLSASGRMSQLYTPKKYRLDYVVTLVGQHAGKLANLSEQSITAQIQNLRQQLLRSGLTEPLIAMSFALIRELSERLLGKRHFDVQLLGGWAMIHGLLAEMETGQGKTLTSSLPSCTAALAGIPVHVITTNDYLASRDAEILKPLYERLGLTVGTVIDGMEQDTRRESYACDIVHTTNKQIAFDYLRDRMEIGDDVGHLSLQFKQIQGAQQQQSSQLVMRGLCFAIVDEADSVLIDEARTPLIISKSNPSEELGEMYRQAIILADALKENDDFALNFEHRQIELTDQGEKRLGELALPMAGLWAGRRRRRELVKQALSAKFLYLKDKHYIVRDDKIRIVDENTGRVMEDRSWEQGLHQMIEVREGCEITGQRDPLARISYQRFFSRYLRLAGMSGTLKEVAGELWSVYGLRMIKIPTHQVSERRALPEKLYVNAEQKWRALVDRVIDLHSAGRPVLIGTCSVSESEFVSDLLTRNGSENLVLNARQDKKEADIIKLAGHRGKITVATNMAGRGTDIELGPGVSDIDGLHVIATERNDSRRVDRQLYGRCARQGDPGSVEAFYSLQDKSMVLYYSDILLRAFAIFCHNDQPLPNWLARIIVALPQKRLQRMHRRIRGRMAKLDEQLAKTLAFSGRSE